MLKAKNDWNLFLVYPYHTIDGLSHCEYLEIWGVSESVNRYTINRKYSFSLDQRLIYLFSVGPRGKRKHY